MIGYSLIAIVLIAFCSIGAVIYMASGGVSIFLWVASVLMSIGVVINIGVELNGIQTHQQKQNEGIQLSCDDTHSNDNTQPSCDDTQNIDS